jgi:hypothetical protein
MHLAPETVGIYLHAILKVFGVWAGELSEKWDDDDLPKVKTLVEEIVDTLQTFASSPDIEVQERVRPLHTTRSCKLRCSSAGRERAATLQLRSGRPLFLPPP